MTFIYFKHAEQKYLGVAPYISTISMLSRYRCKHLSWMWANYIKNVFPKSKLTPSEPTVTQSSITDT